MSERRFKLGGRVINIRLQESDILRLSVIDFVYLEYATRVSKMYEGTAKILCMLLDIINQAFMLGSRREGLAILLFLIRVN